MTIEPHASVLLARHASVLLEEAVAALAVVADGCYVDATFGRGGHSRAILDRLGPAGRVIALDRDLAAIESSRRIEDARLRAIHAPFERLAEAVRASEGAQVTVNGVLFDLGVSSPQIDTPERGFSFRADGPLDMRMDQTRGMTAAEWLAAASESSIKEVIRNYGEERFAGQIAKAIVAARARGPLSGTRQLAALVGTAVRTREPGQDPATRTFQALRIHINQELAQLQIALPQAAALLAVGGRLVVISFHSLEDRIVKHYLRDEAHPEHGLPAVPWKASELPQPRLRVIGKPIRAGAAEVAANPRARSAILRVAEKL